MKKWQLLFKTPNVKIVGIDRPSKNTFQTVNAIYHNLRSHFSKNASSLIL